MSGLSPASSAIRVDAALEEKLKGASFEEIKVYMAEQAVAQGLVERDQYDPAVLIPTERANAARQQFTKNVTIDGLNYNLVADNEHDLAIAETNLYRSAVNHHAAAIATEQPRNERGQFTATPSISDAEKDALSLQFSLGQITVQDYLERSGAVDSYLEKQGVSVDALRDVTSAKVEQSGDAIVQAFLNGPGQDWPGGDANLATASRLLSENSLSLSVENLVAVYDHMREHNLVAETPATRARQQERELEVQIADTKNPYELRSVLQPSSGLFGR
jgi:hypothetical protein